MDRKVKIILLGLVAVALVARLVFAGFVVGWHTPPKGDEIDYMDLATSLADGEGYRVRGTETTARRPFFYPATLALMFKVIGPSPAAARIAQVLLGTLIVVLVFLLARRYFDPRTALIAAALTAFNPFLVFISGYILTENTYMALLLGLLFFAPRPDELTTQWRRMLAVAVLFGAACLARPTTLGVMIWTMCAVWLFGSDHWQRKWIATVTIVGTVLVMLLPWAARNNAVFGKWVFFTTHGGVTFYQGNNQKVIDIPQYRGGVAPLAALPEYDRLKTMPTLAKDEAAYALGFSFLRENKREVPGMVWRKAQRFWRLRSDVGLSGIRSGWWFNKDSTLGKLAATLDVGFVYAIVVMPLFLIGMVVLSRRYREFILLYGMVVVHSVYPLIFHGSIRMRIPIEPVIAIFAAYAVTWVWVRMRRPDQASG